MIDEIVYVIKTDFGFKGHKGIMVQSVNRAVFYQTQKMAEEQIKGYIVNENPKVIKLQLKEVTE